MTKSMTTGLRSFLGFLFQTRTDHNQFGCGGSHGGVSTSVGFASVFAGRSGREGPRMLRPADKSGQTRLCHFAALRPLGTSRRRGSQTDIGRHRLACRGTTHPRQGCSVGQVAVTPRCWPGIGATICAKPGRIVRPGTCSSVPVRPMLVFSARPPWAVLFCVLWIVLRIRSYHRGAHVFRHSLATRMLRHGRFAGANRPGAPPSERSDDRSLRESRFDCPAPTGPPLARRCPMKSLGRHLKDYITLRRQLGFKFYVEGSYLRGFVRFAQEQRARFISTKLALRLGNTACQHHAKTTRPAVGRGAWICGIPERCSNPARKSLRKN